jgi:glycosyltransferase involved in cell wall biosynthesis
MPLFSVLIPTRDRPDFLRDALSSVLAQDMKDLELIVINDGASPIPPPNDPRVRVVDNKQRGAVPARNLGLKEARGEFVAFLDDDDFWISRQHLSNAARVLESVADFYFADGVMSMPGEDLPRRFARDADVKSLEKDNTVLVSTVCYKRKLHAALGLFDESLPYYWDWDWYLRVARDSFRLYRDINPAVNIRVHAHNMSAGNAEARQRNLVRFSLKHGIGPLTLKNHTDFSEVGQA